MWYVIWTEARSEYQLKSRIEKDIDSDLYSSCWVPTKTEQRKLDGKYTEVERILFPGYIFIDTDDPEKLHIEIRKTKYNSRVMKTGEYFTPISRTEEEIIRHLTGDDGRMGISTGIIEDGNLKVIDGPLKGFEKYIVRIDRHKRKAWLKIKLFGEERKFNAGLCVIEKTMKVN